MYQTNFMCSFAERDARSVFDELGEAGLQIQHDVMEIYAIGRNCLYNENILQGRGLSKLCISIIAKAAGPNFSITTDFRKHKFSILNRSFWFGVITIRSRKSGISCRLITAKIGESILGVLFEEVKKNGQLKPESVTFQRAYCRVRAKLVNSTVRFA